jgi:hypothetical protein
MFIMFRAWVFFGMLFLVIAPVFGESLKTLEPSSFPSLIASTRIDAPLDFCGEPVPLEVQAIRERLEKELMLMLWDRPQVILWLKRAGRYLPHMEEMLRQSQMPADLKYVSIIESALRPHVGSPKGAMGFWQFMEGTGRKYGLEINADVDQRRNVFESTQAAIRFFKDLYGMLGSWTLSAAAFNMGEKGLQAEIMAQKTDNYYDLYLPLETQRYVLRIIVAKLILSRPETYGFRLKEDDVYPLLEFDRIRLEVNSKTPIYLIAQAADTTFKAIKDLNPEIRGHYVARGNHSILLPEGRAQGFDDRYQKLVEHWLAKNSMYVYVVKKGDNLTAIADRFEVPLPALAIWNDISLHKPIHPGQRLIVYPRSSAADKTFQK